ncbi:MAG: zinc ribbon domain-containing protein [bacterium]
MNKENFEEADEYFCSACGAKVDFNDEVCNFCGAILEDEENVEEIDEYYCSDCGAKVDFEDKNCKVCGTSLEEIESEENIVKLCEVPDNYTADLAIQHLLSYGIESYKGCGTYLGASISGYVSLNVLEKDLKKAAEILIAMNIIE